MNQTKVLLDLDCTKKCHSRGHISVLTSAVTKRSVDDSQLASFLVSSCHNFMRGLDKEGRTILHMVASRGRRSLLDWLIRGSSSGNTQGVPLIDVRDLESGYTPLHRSIYYGQINTTVELMKKGANTTILDYDDYTSIDHALLDRPPLFSLNKNMPCEVYVWGTNNNYTSGTGSQHQKFVPELLTSFTKQNISIKQVSVSKFHSIFVSSCGGVWTCGHGEGGRLGTMAGGTCVLPTPINLQEPCVQVAIARDHTVLLMQSGLVITCGLNNHYQLGIVPPPPNVLAPRATRLKLANAKGVCAGRYHTVAFSSRSLYMWGLNGGQLGHSKGDAYIIEPRKVLRFSEETVFECASASDGATIVSTSKGDIYLFHQHQCKRIASGQHNIESIRVVGGEIIGGDKLTDYQKKLSVLVLYKSGFIYLWQDTTNMLIRCIFSMNRPICVKDIALTRESVMLVTKQGETFQGTIIPKKVKQNKAGTTVKDVSGNNKDTTQFNKLIDKDECVIIRIKKLPNIHRAVGVSADMNGSNFAVLQVNPNNWLLEIPQVTSSQLSNDMLTLLQEANEYDLIHDVVVKVDFLTFPAHKYILSNGSEYFAKLCTKNIQNDGLEKQVITLENVHPEIARRMLEYLYTGTCDLLNLGPCNLEIKKELNLFKNNDASEVIEDSSNNHKSAFEVYKNTKNLKSKKNMKQKEKAATENTNSDIYDPVRLLQAAAKKFQVTTLHKLLSKYCYSNGNIFLKENDRSHKVSKLTFNRKNMPELYDINIVCDDKYVIKAHKCMLVARLDYFNGMFGHSWTENTLNRAVSLPVHSALLEPIIDFLYTDECPKLNKTEDVEFLSNMLVLSDQFFITRIREMCEVAFSKLINLKNVPEIFQLANTYNCPQLKQCCMEYISFNLPSLLESKSLETTPPELLEDLTKYYASYNPLMCSRVITPFFDAPSEETIQLCADNLPTDLSDEFKEEILDNVKKDLNVSIGKKIKTRTKTLSFSESDRVRRRNESTSSLKSLDASLDDSKTTGVTLALSSISISSPKEKTSTDWVKVDTKKKQNKVIEARLKAAIAVKENSDILNYHQDSFTTLIKQERSYDHSLSAESPPIQSPVLGNDSRSPPSPSPSPTSLWPDNNDAIARTTQTSLSIVVDKKLSQKQRKKLALENKELGRNLDQLNRKTTAWSVDSYPVDTDTVIQPIKPNPWQKIEPSPSSSLPKRKEVKMDFTQILEDERKQKENLNRMMAKPLALTQLEDKAIDDLLKHYSNNFGEEERISVKRVQCYQMAAPQWIHRASSVGK